MVQLDLTQIAPQVFFDTQKESSLIITNKEHLLRFDFLLEATEELYLIKQQLERRQLGSHAVKTWSHLGPIQVHRRSLLGSYSHYCWMTCMKHIFLLNHCVSSGLREVSTSLNGHLLESTTVFPLILGRTCFRINSKEIVPCAVVTFERRIPRCGHNSF